MLNILSSKLESATRDLLGTWPTDNVTDDMAPASMFFILFLELSAATENSTVPRADTI